jgi:hypothetical protein
LIREGKRRPPRIGAKDAPITIILARMDSTPAPTLVRPISGVAVSVPLEIDGRARAVVDRVKVTLSSPTKSPTEHQHEGHHEQFDRNA